MDETVLEGIGAAQQLQNNVGTVPDEVVKLLKQGPAAHLQHHAFVYRRQFDKELAAIRRIKELQLRGVALVGTLFGALVKVALVGGTGRGGELIAEPASWPVAREHCHEQPIGTHSHRVAVEGDLQPATR